MSSQEQQDDQERFDKQVAGGSDDLDDLGKLGTAPTPPPMIKTATYPNNLPQKNQLRRFARSAQKRQSVQLLGSIEHLQHHFVRNGGNILPLEVGRSWSLVLIGYSRVGNARR